MDEKVHGQSERAPCTSSGCGMQKSDVETECMGSQVIQDDLD
jgi:hypothetical protein